MNWNFSAWAIRNPVPPILIFAVLMLLGIVGFKRLAIEQFPNIDVPVIAVSVGLSGATPSELETQVTKIIEDSVAGISGVKHITSTLSDGQSTTAVEFDLQVPTQKALQDTKDAVARIRGNLPGGVDEPITQSVDVEGQAIQQYAVKAPGMTLEQLSWYVDDTVKRGLQGLKGVGRIDRYGGVEREIRINLDPLKLQAWGVTAAQINQQLSQTNQDSGAGRGEVGGLEQAIRTIGGAKNLEDLKQISISLPGGRYVRLADLGQIEDSQSEQVSYATYNGESVVTFSVFRAKGASSTEVAERVTKQIEELTKNSKGAVSFELIDDTVFFIHGNYEAAMAGLIEGSILAVIVVFLFLRNIRATFISAVALPLSAIPTFFVMQWLGFSLNLVSFLAITLATGILVDDAIVEIENIARHMKMGKSAYRASLEAADEIGLAVIAITFSIVCVFAPVSFMGGVAGQYFKQFGLTVAIAVLFSLLVARLITPMMAAYLMRDIPHEEHEPGWIMRSYIAIIRFLNFRLLSGQKLIFLIVGSSLAAPLIVTLGFFKFTVSALLGFWLQSHWLVFSAIFVIVLFGLVGLTILTVLLLSAVLPLFARGLSLVFSLLSSIAYFGWLSSFLRRCSVVFSALSKASPGINLMSYVTVVASFAILLSSIMLFPRLPSGFIPQGDDSRFVLSVQLPPGTRLEDTRKATDQLAQSILQNKEVTGVFVLGGASPTGTVEPRRASLFVNLAHRDSSLYRNLWNRTFLGYIYQFEWKGRVTPQWDIESDVLPKLSSIPDVKWAKINPRGEREVAFDMLSTDAVALRDAAMKLEAALRQNPKLRAPEAEGALTRPEIHVVPKSDEAARLGITPAQISQTVRVATIGDFSPLLAKFTVGDRQIPIRVQLPEKARTSLAEIANLKVTAQDGKSVPLSSVADVMLGDGPSTVQRYDRARQSTIGADLPVGVELGDATKIIEDTAKGLNFPSVIKLKAGGDAEIQGEVQQGFLFAAALGVGLMFVLLVLLLGNIFQPFAILLSLPLSLGGVILALLIRGQAFSMPVIIGLLMLIGIVAKNAIMLVDFAVERKRHGMDRLDAVVDAGLKRARPIVMTTIAMGAGMFPTALGIGEGSSFRSPMATAVIGGLIGSTILSLVFVPSFYVVMDDLARLFRWLFSRFIGATDEPHVEGLQDLSAKQTKTTAMLEKLADKVEELEDSLARPAARSVKAAE